MEALSENIITNIIKGGEPIAFIRVWADSAF